MSFRGDKSLYRALIVVIITGAFASISYGTITVSISGVTDDSSETALSLPASKIAPSDSFRVKATITGTPTKVVFYRNDVPYKTVTSSPWRITENELGQDTYIYHARAYESETSWAESGDFQMTVKSGVFIRMGIDVSTTGPDQSHDHTDEIQAAVNYLKDRYNGGTLFFPCTVEGTGPAVYNISNTVVIPSNVTLQSESSEPWGKCQIRWFQYGANYNETGGTCTGQAPSFLRDKPMFLIAANTRGVRFKDLTLHSRASGPNCYPRTGEGEKIRNEHTSAIEMSTDGVSDNGGIFNEVPTGGDISDVIFENVSISDFTNGIKAVSTGREAYEISGIKIRGYRAENNYRQLFIDAQLAYDWDVQNLNILYMGEDQGGVEILNAGKPSEYMGDKAKLKFLQLNCNGDPDRQNPRPAFCVQVSKHAGLYFRQLHHEGVNKAIITTPLDGDPNTEPIVMESSIATGEFNDASMNLYLIGNTIYAPEGNVPSFPEDGRLRFFDAGVGSKVVDCGDYHRDFTTPSMLFTHSERNRGSFFAKNGTGPTYIKPHTICPRDVPGEQKSIDEYGGDFFDSGVLPDKDEPGLYFNTLDPSMCNSSTCADQLDDLLENGGTVYIDGTLTLNHTVTIPKGSQIVGSPNAVLVFSAGTDIEYPFNQVLFRINIPATGDPASSIAVRNLKLKTAQMGKIGIQMLGDINAIGGSKNMYFSGLGFDGFATGIEARAGDPTHDITNPPGPQIDGIGLKDMTFTNEANVNNSNAKAIDSSSTNASNWNVMNLKITSNSSSAIGWNQRQGGYLGLQDVRCTGSGTAMTDCINLKMVTGFFLNGLRKTVNVTNSVTIKASDTVQPSTVVLRNNDFTGGGVNVEGESFITSMNNRYGTINVAATDRANISRLTYCGDTYPVTTPATLPYTGLAADYNNVWVGIKTPTRIECGTRPVPWEDAVRWGGGIDDTPLTGNIYDNNREDFVIYRGGSSPQWLIQKRAVGTDERKEAIIPADPGTPFVGKFIAGSNRSQVVTFKVDSTGLSWHMTDPMDCNHTTGCNRVDWSWGFYAQDIGLVGNFQDDYLDEIAFYHPYDQKFYIVDPRGSGHSITTNPVAKVGEEFLVGDFQGLGHDQIAQYENEHFDNDGDTHDDIGTWYIFDPLTGAEIEAGWGGLDGDVPVTGTYLPPATSTSPQCSQLGIWRELNQTLYVADVNSLCGSRTDRELYWGSKNDFSNVFDPGFPECTYYPSIVPPFLNCKNDIPLTVKDDVSLIDRPVSYRPTKGAYPDSIANGQWWVHDKLP